MTAPRSPDLSAAAGVIVRASMVMTAAAVASRVLGWVRLLVIGAEFGATSELDAYLAAFRIPDAIFQLIVAGALSAALIPVYAGYRARGEEDEGWALASSVINLVVLALVGLSAAMAIAAPWLVPIIAPGFDPETTALTVRLTQIMLLSPVFIGLGAVVSGLLQSHGVFGPTALAPLGLQPRDHRCGRLRGAPARRRGPGRGRRGGGHRPPRRPAAGPATPRSDLAAPD